MIQLYMKHITLLAAALLAAACTVKAPAPYGPCPTPAQVEWQRMETNLFIHFGPNTFSGKEWGGGHLQSHGHGLQPMGTGGP